MLWYQSVPLFLQKLFPGLVWRLPAENGKVVYLTFDDGPHPEISLWVAGQLRDFGMKATFFCVGDNVRKFPETFKALQEEGHQTGNHTMHHIKGWNHRLSDYIEDVQECSRFVPGTLFRPPYGRISRKQIKALGKTYRIVMWSLLSLDFDRSLNPQKALKGLMRKTRNGSVVVFHDSVKSEKNLKYMLPPYLQFLKQQGYSCQVL